VAFLGGINTPGTKYVILPMYVWGPGKEQFMVEIGDERGDDGETGEIGELGKSKRKGGRGVSALAGSVVGRWEKSTVVICGEI